MSTFGIGGLAGLITVYVIRKGGVISVADTDP